MAESFVQCSAQCGCGSEVTAKAGIRDGELVVQLRTSHQAVEQTAPSMRVHGVSKPEVVVETPTGPSLRERLRGGSDQ